MPLSNRSTPQTIRGLRWLAGSALLASLLACGYKGPLYLPPPEAPSSELTTPPEQDAPPAGFVSPLDQDGPPTGLVPPPAQDAPPGTTVN